MSNACSALPLVVLLAAAAVCSAEPHGRPNITVIAHRGNSSHAPENTLAAFRSAVRARADYVELDAYASADGTLWVHHDKTLDRTTDIERYMKGEKIAFKSVPDVVLAKLDAGAWFSTAFRGEHLPRLAESLDLIQAGSKTLLEHKEGPARAYADLLKSKDLVNRLIVQSFNWEFLADLHAILPNQQLAALGGKELTSDKIAQLPRTGATIVAWDFRQLRAQDIAGLHLRGFRVWCYTVDEAADWKRLIADGIDGIITNRPAELRTWLETGIAPPPATAPATRAPR